VSAYSVSDATSEVVNRWTGAVSGVTAVKTPFPVTVQVPDRRAWLIWSCDW